MTYRDYDLVMSDVRIADFEGPTERASPIGAQRDHAYGPRHRDTPVARIVLYAAQPLEIRKAKRRLRHEASTQALEAHRQRRHPR